MQDKKDKTKMQHLNERVQCLFMDILTQKIHKLICFEDILIQLPVFGYESESLTSIIRNKIVEKSSSLSFRSKNSANWEMSNRHTALLLLLLVIKTDDLAWKQEKRDGK